MLEKFSRVALDAPQLPQTLLTRRFFIKIFLLLLLLLHHIYEGVQNFRVTLVWKLLSVERVKYMRAVVQSYVREFYVFPKTERWLLLSFGSLLNAREVDCYTCALRARSYVTTSARVIGHKPRNYPYILHTIHTRTLGLYTLCIQIYTSWSVGNRFGIRISSTFYPLPMP